MSIPGSHDEKLALLSELNQYTFVQVVADILKFTKGHTDVKVVDGTGDGTRDIHSISSDGERFITQCKFHQDTRTFVGSRETNELAIAFVKFGVKRGAFFTSGRFSPQAHREFLDYYTDYDVEGIQGTDMVDIILNTPLLSAIWFDGEKVTSTRHAIAIPFFIRSLEQDAPIPLKINVPSRKLQEKIQITFKNDTFPSFIFTPYRYPQKPTLGEGLNDRVNSTVAIFTGAHILEYKDNLPEFVLERLKQVLADQELGDIAIRFGDAYLTVLQGEDSGSRIFLETESKTFYRILGGDFESQDDWLLPSQASNWKFTEDVRISEGPWARWHNPLHDTNLEIEVICPPAQSMEGMHRLQTIYLREQWDKSFFMVGSQKECQHFLSVFGNEFPKPETCDYGLDGMMMGWLTPAPGFIHTDVDNHEEDDDFVGQFHAQLREEQRSFDVVLSQLRSRMSHTELREVSSNQARYILASHLGFDQFSDPEEIVHRPVDLVFQSDVLPSPVRPQSRQFRFEQVWFTCLSERSVESEILYLSSKLNADLERSAHGNGTYIIVTMNFVADETTSTQILIDRYESRAITLFGEFFEELRARISDLRMFTSEYWKEEIGFSLPTE